MKPIKSTVPSTVVIYLRKSYLDLRGDAVNVRRWEMWGTGGPFFILLGPQQVQPGRSKPHPIMKKWVCDKGTFDITTRHDYIQIFVGILIISILRKRKVSDVQLSNILNSKVVDAK